jgi:hypothetical protein
VDAARFLSGRLLRLRGQEGSMEQPGQSGKARQGNSSGSTIHVPFPTSCRVAFSW